MSSIDEKIGGLMADMRHVREDMSTLLHRSEKTNKDIVIQQYKMEEAEKRLDNLEPKVNTHEKIKNKAFGMAAGFSLFGGVIVSIGHTLIRIFM